MNEPIRVLHVFGRLDAGGAESRTMDIYRHIDREKVQFDFAIHTEDKCFFTDEVIDLGGRIYSFPRFNGKNYFEYKQSWAVFFEQHTEYKVVHGHQTSTAFVYLREAKKKNIAKRIAHARNSNKDSFVKNITTRFAKFYATDLLAVSKLAAISEFGQRDVSRGKVKVIPNAIETKKYKFSPDTRKVTREKLGFNNELLIIHIGRFHVQKNHEFLIDIFQELSKTDSGAKLLLVGDGPLKSKIENKVQQLNLEDKVMFIGIRNDVPDLLQAADILIFPSFYEGLPGVVLEAQAAGLPCVISDRITDEVSITNLVTYLSLVTEKQLWVDCIIYNYKKNNNREKIFEEIKEKGYDIEDVAVRYELFYKK